MTLKPSHTAESVKSLKILLAEDNFVNQRLALLLLEKLGYAADAVNNGEEVLQALQRQFYDVILMDVQMPKMCGITATQKICTLYPAPKRPYIIALTAFAIESDAEKCLNAGMQGHLTKPIDAEALALTLQRLEQQRCTVEIPADRSASSTKLSEPSELSEPSKSSKPTAEVQLDPRFLAKYKKDSPILEQQIIESIRKMAGMAAQTLIEQLVDSYITEAPVMLNRLYQAMEIHDGVALYKAAHALRSSSANLGALHLAQICEWIEEQGRLGTVLILNDYQPLLDDKYRTTKAALMAIR